MGIRKSLSLALRVAKEQSGLKSEDLMEDSGVSRSGINSALNGGDQVGIKTFERLFNACGYQVEIVLQEDENDLF